VLLPGHLQMQVNRTSTQWQSHPALRDMQAARRGRRGIPYAAYLALSAIGWVLASIYGGWP
jgi:prepilin peptidase CpaA